MDHRQRKTNNATKNSLDQEKRLIKSVFFNKKKIYESDSSESGYVGSIAVFGSMYLNEFFL